MTTVSLRGSGDKKKNRKAFYILIIIITIRAMKKMLLVISDEAYAILKGYKEDNDIANLDTALDELLKERVEGKGK